MGFIIDLTVQGEAVFKSLLFSKPVIVQTCTHKQRNTA